MQKIASVAACAPFHYYITDQTCCNLAWHSLQPNWLQLYNLAQSKYTFPDLQAPEALDSSIHALLQTPWTAWGALLTCDLLQEQEEACQVLAKMTFPELAVIRQVGLPAVQFRQDLRMSCCIVPVAFIVRTDGLKCDSLGRHHAALVNLSLLCHSPYLLGSFLAQLLTQLLTQFFTQLLMQLLRHCSKLWLCARNCVCRRYTCIQTRQEALLLNAQSAQRLCDAGSCAPPVTCNL